MQTVEIFLLHLVDLVVVLLMEQVLDLEQLDRDLLVDLQLVVFMAAAAAVLLQLEQLV
jgi:hypothetical protein